MSHFEQFPPAPVHPNAQNLNDMMLLFQELGGLMADTYARYPALQEPHMIASKSAIKHAADTAVRTTPNPANRRALILGAGACFDIPLRQVTEAFEQTTIVEMDVDASRLAVSRLPLRLRKKTQVVHADITGFLQPVNAVLQQAVQQPEWPQFACSIGQGLQDIDPVQALPDLGQDYAFVSSHLVTSVLANTAIVYADRLSYQTYGTYLGGKAPDDAPQVLDAQLSIQAFSNRANIAHLDLLKQSVADTGVVHFADTLLDIENDQPVALVTARINEELAARFDRIGESRSWPWQADPARRYMVSQSTLALKSD